MRTPLSPFLLLIGDGVAVAAVVANAAAIAAAGDVVDRFEGDSVTICDGVTSDESSSPPRRATICACRAAHGDDGDDGDDVDVDDDDDVSVSGGASAPAAEDASTPERSVDFFDVFDGDVCLVNGKPAYRVATNANANGDGDEDDDITEDNDGDGDEDDDADDDADDDSVDDVDVDTDADIGKGLRGDGVSPPCLLLIGDGVADVDDAVDNADADADADKGKGLRGDGVSPPL
jgi:hypothetical protein